MKRITLAVLLLLATHVAFGQSLKDQAKKILKKEQGSASTHLQGCPKLCPCSQSWWQSAFFVDNKYFLAITFIAVNPKDSVLNGDVEIFEIIGSTTDRTVPVKFSMTNSSDLSIMNDAIAHFML